MIAGKLGLPRFGDLALGERLSEPQVVPVVVLV
jgi:hypothetical protein